MWPDYIEKLFHPVTALAMVVAAALIFLAVAGVTVLVLAPSALLATGVLLWMRRSL